MIAISSQSWGWKIGVVSFIAIGGAIATSFDCALAQITPDATLGAESSVVTPTNVNSLPGQQIDGGATRGANLFHSFEQFSIPTGSEAFFNNALDIQNIISRVTGLSISNIDGLLRANGTANLFLLNPNGISFGPNASLNIGGSFVGSTASSLNFADGTQFSASVSTTPVLTVSVPIGLQYGGTAGSILNQSRATNSSGQVVGLQVQPGATLAILGGDVILDGGSLQALGGRVELGGIAGAGTVGLNVNGNNLSLSFPDSVARADVSLSNGSLVDVRAAGGGSIAINAGNLNVLEGSKLLAGIGENLQAVGSKAGDVTLNATDAITIGQSSEVQNRVNDLAIGDSGDINVTAGSLSITDGAFLSASTLGQGNAGNVNVNVSDAVTLSGVSNDADNISRIASVIFAGAVGNGGTITIKAGELSIIDGALLNTSISASPDNILPGGRGTAGNVNIDVSGPVTISGVNVIYGDRSSITSPVGSGAEGNGGSITINAESLSVTDGAELDFSTSGQGNAGSVNINVRDTVSFDGGDAFSTVEEGAEGNSGGINITTGLLSLTNGAQLAAGTRGRGNASSVNINARDTVSFDGVSSDGLFPSGPFSIVGDQAEGNGGDIAITTGLLSVTNGAVLNSSTFGQGNAGSVNINARDTVSFDEGGVLSTVQEGAVGNSGGINVTTGSLSLNNGAVVNSSTLGQGDAGSVNINAHDTVSIDERGVLSIVEEGAVGNSGGINITTGSLSLTNGAQLAAGTRGRGNAGSVNINARDTVSFDGVSSDGLLSSGPFSIVGPVAEGNGGDIAITTGSLSVTDGAVLNSSTFGQGNAGSVNINARDTVSFDEGGVLSIVEAGAVGNSGGINVTTGSLSTNGAQLAAGTRGRGNAGSVNINARDTVSFDGVDSNGFSSGAFSTVEEGAVGNGGGINVTSGSLSVTNGATLNTSTSGQGNAGNLQVNAVESIELIGTTPNGGLVSGLSTDTFGTGAAGNLGIDTRKLIVQDGAVAAARTFGSGQGGTLTVNAAESIELIGTTPTGESVSGLFTDAFDTGAAGNLSIDTGKLIVRDGAVAAARTFGSGQGGTLTVNAANSVELIGTTTNGERELVSGLSTGTRGAGAAGNLTIETGQLTVRDSAEVSVSSQGSGNAGNLEVVADSISLDNLAALSANTTAGQGNIILRSADLVLRRGSNITTNATGTVEGGNITIDTGVIAALENSDISSNAQSARGGQVIIDAQGIFGTEFRNQLTPLSDITANSELGTQFSGSVELNTPDVDPTQGLIELPVELVDVSNQIAQGCPANVARGESKFVITGRGGLPPNPNDPLTGDNVLTTWNTLDSDAVTSSGAAPATNSTKENAPTQIVEADGWMINNKGEVVLTATAPTTTLVIPWVPSSECRAPETLS